MTRLRTPATVLIAILAFGTALPPAPSAQQPAGLTEALLAPFTYRNLGPFRMGARTSDIAVPTSSNGLWRLH